jgi:hypothetical protein
MKTSKKDKIYSAYMDYVVKKHNEPKSVAHFCKKMGLSEKSFYKRFDDISELRNSIFSRFHYHTLKALHDSEDYDGLQTKDQVMVYYFSFFEILKLNEEYVHYALRKSKHKLNACHQLKEYRKDFINFIGEKKIRECIIPNHRVKTIHNRLVSESMWGELMFILQFWLKDKSKSSEKTDLMIEKTLTATFEMLEKEIPPSVIDFFKFVFKEQFKGGSKFKKHSKSTKKKCQKQCKCSQS